MFKIKHLILRRKIRHNGVPKKNNFIMGIDKQIKLVTMKCWIIYGEFQISMEI